MFGRRVLADAVTQVEDVGGPALVGVGVRRAKAVEHTAHFFLDARRWCKQDVRVDIALQGLSRSAHLATHQGSCFTQVDRPVQAQHLAVELAHLRQP